MLPLYTVFLISGALVAYWAYDRYSSLQRNIKAAQASGLPYVVVPLNMYSRVWLIFSGLIIPHLQRLPARWTASWLDYLEGNWAYTKLYSAFEKEGNDTFLTVSPKKILIWVATPSIIHQIGQKRDLFPKPLDSYKILDIYGKSLVSLEGADWRKHRKITSPSFTEKNNALVFHEAIAQTQSMIKKWTSQSGGKTLTTVPADAMRVALHIISMVGFGVRLLWPGETEREEDKIAGAVNYGSSEPPPGHTMSFAHALETLLENLVWILLFPAWLLPKLPFAGAKIANESFKNWSQFMNELFVQKVNEARTGQKSQGMDLLGGLVKSSYSPDTSASEKGGKTGLSDGEILGNAFVMILAGHETTANSIHFASVLLATTPSSQRNLQSEIQTIFGDSDPATWDYDENINALLGGMVGAVLNEELRLMPPVIAIPKTVSAHAPQAVYGPNGEKYILPAGAFISLVSAAVHRNPNYWPSLGPSKVTPTEKNDLNDFVPERWLVDNHDKSAKESEKLSAVKSDADGFGGFTGEASSASLFRPAPGAFIAFSEGARSCIGRRLAQVEVVAVLATIFQKYSIELAVDEWATDEEVERMSRAERIAVYTKAIQKARKIIKEEPSMRITLKLHGEIDHIPLRVVRKGEERFLGLFE